MLVHRFSRYMLFPAGLVDLGLARDWTLQDPDHGGRVKPEFWIEQGQGFESWLLKDPEGPVYFFKAVHCDRDIEVHIQFPPYPSSEPTNIQLHHRLRMATALIEGMRWLEQQVRGFREIRFESRNENLIRFAERHLGFVNDGGQLSKRLQSTEAPNVRIH